MLKKATVPDSPILTAKSTAVHSFLQASGMASAVFGGESKALVNALIQIA